MRAFDLALRGGRLVGPDAVLEADIYIRSGRIAALAQPEQHLDAVKVVDLAGNHIFPGLIDAHTHFRTFSGHCDDFVQMATSAAHGGITSVLAFVMGMNASPHRLRERFEHFLSEATGAAPIDFGFHAGLADEPGVLEDLDALFARGVSSFKMFMAYRARRIMVDDGFMLRAMRMIRSRDGIAMVHAEAGDAIDCLEATLTDDDAASYLRSRPAWTEAEAVGRALRLADEADCPLYLVHLSSAESLDVIRSARQRGQRVYAETCPHYLALTHDDVQRIGPGAKIAPPIRSAADRMALVDAVLRREIDVVGSDHAPYSSEVKKRDGFMAAPVGAPGTETLLGVTWKVLSEAGATPSALTRVLSANPARIFGLHPRKGSLSVGADADVAVIDLAGETVIDGGRQHNASGYSLYQGWRVPLTLEATYLRGVPLLRAGQLRGAARGRYLHRSNP